MNIVEALSRLTETQLINAVSAANTAAATSAGFDLSGYEGSVRVIQQTGAITGTLDGKVQASTDNSTWNDLATAADGLVGAQVTTANQIRAVALDVRSIRTSVGSCRYIRYVGTVVTGPVLISVIVVGFRKYMS